MLWLGWVGEDVLNIEVRLSMMVCMLSSLAMVMKNRRWTACDRSLH